jgi:MFS family permease
MFMSPLSEVYGRVPVYHTANIIFVTFIIGNALSRNVGQFLVFRFISGCAGGNPMALGGGTIADITTIEQRAVAMAFFSMGPLAGPVSLISGCPRLPFELFDNQFDLVPGPWPCHWRLPRCK